MCANLKVIHEVVHEVIQEAEVTTEIHEWITRALSYTSQDVVVRFGNHLKYEEQLPYS